MADPADQFSTAQATERKAEEISGAHHADRYRGEFLERRTHGQQSALQPLAGQQDGDADEEGGYRRESVFHGAAFCYVDRLFGRKKPDR